MLERLRLGIGVLVLAACALAGARGTTHADDGIQTPGDRPDVLARVGVTGPLSAFAISADGRLAALAADDPERPGQTALELYSTDLSEPLSNRIQGDVRDLLFATDGSVLYGILHRAAKRSGGDTHLVLIDLANLKVKRGNRLPVGAADLDHWITANALLIAAPGEIRTLLLPDLRSGPLFAVTGANHSVASLGGSSLILVGQAGGLDLIDLEDRPGQEEMPVREHLDTRGSIHGLAAAADGTSALARQNDGSLYTVEFQPLRARPAGSGFAVAAPPVVTALPPPARRLEAPPPRRIPPVTEEAEEALPADEETAPPATRPTPPKSPVAPTAEQERAAPPAVPAPAEAATAVVPTTAPAVTPPSSPPTPSRPPATAPSGGVAAQPTQPPPGAAQAQLSGLLTGEARGRVEFVVIRGPNSLLREAARVRPDSAGSWSVDGLAPGNYRIQLDAGGGTVMVSRPPFVAVELSAGAGPRVLETIEALRVF